MSLLKAPVPRADSARTNPWLKTASGAPLSAPTPTVSSLTIRQFTFIKD